MHFANSLWSTVTYLASWVTLSPFSKDLQQPLPAALDVKVIGTYVDNNFPDFKPPGGRLHWKGSDFNCTYPDMPEWEFCSTPGDRSCWLQHPDGRRYDTHTNYEIDAPRGIDRYYEFQITDGTYNADGLIATDVKLVNKKYPGPWVQACWGDVSVLISPPCPKMKLMRRTENHCQSHQQDGSQRYSYSLARHSTKHQHA